MTEIVKIIQSPKVIPQRVPYSFMYFSPAEDCSLPMKFPLGWLLAA